MVERFAERILVGDQRRKNNTGRTVRVRASLRGNVVHVEVFAHKNQITPTVTTPTIQKKIKPASNPRPQPDVSLLPW